MYAYPSYRLNRSVTAVIMGAAAVIGALMAPITLTSTTEASAPAVSAVVTTPAQQVDPAARAIAAQQHVTLAQAETRLSWQQAVPSLNTALSNQLSAATLGGIWIAPNDGDRVKVGVVGLTPGVRAIVIRAVRAVGLSGATDLVRAKYSLGQLVSADTWLAAQLDKLSSRKVGAIHLDADYRTDLNRVQLVMAGHNLAAEEQALVARAKARYGDLVQVAAQPAGSAIATPLDCTDNLSVGQFCNAPLRGGIEIFTVNSQGHSQKGVCTGGFIARSRTDGKLYQFTAGHCAVEVPNGATNRWATGFANLTGHVIGTVQHYIWASSGDEAILNINNPTEWHLPQGWVAVMAGPNTTLNEKYPISSAQYSTEGARVCESGEASGSICGTVKALGVSWCYDSSILHCTRVNNLGEASFCGHQGDSGAPVFAAHQAFGLVAALQTNIYGNCTGGTFYQGIIGASNAMNVNIVLAHLPTAARSARVGH
jgi:hypothetical protein